ncbi:MAG: class I SAM-dependent methyltransferase [Bryobacteraceae bacterium]
MTDFKYVGSELELFAAVHNWKSYWSRRIQPFVTGDVLEVGAGIGSNTPFLDPGGNGRWVCLEPDSGLIAQLTENLTQTTNRRAREAVSGTLQSLGASQKFDTIIYIDVLEHIEKDREELESAASRLRAGGRIIVLSPAHQRLFTLFDAAIGHFRRYNRPMLRSISPPSLRLEQLFYLDSAGLVLSIANLLLLRQSMPTTAQLRIWDGWVVPVSRVLDRCLFNSVGKSIVGIWRRERGKGLV